MKYLKGSTVRPVYKKLLIAAIAIYIIGSCMIQSDLYRKLGRIEHQLCHITGK
ncbi:MAG: hypothetical protein PHI59_10535 [Candidatus Omnitrophica bacterium]|nr:hypothetical protein [Candidatus Omnitrophota bacterium]